VAGDRQTGGLTRALAFLRAIDERASTEIRSLPFGTAYLHPSLPQVWSRNFIRVEAPAQQLDVAAMIEAAEQVHAAAGLTHRRLVFDDEGAAGAAAVELQPRGWTPGRNVLMTHGGPELLDDTDTAGAREVEPEAVHEPKRAMMRTDPEQESEETMRQILAADAVIGAVAAERCFGYVLDGRVVAFCRLFSDGSTAQIEDVETVAEFRRRGFSAAVLAVALREAWAAHDFVFVEADAGDWPKDWYGRLGFTTVGAIPQLLRRP
jgi:GNAT superfamily N-acetyltransferase